MLERRLQGVVVRALQRLDERDLAGDVVSQGPVVEGLAGGSSSNLTVVGVITRVLMDGMGADKADLAQPSLAEVLFHRAVEGLNIATDEVLRGADEGDSGRKRQEPARDIDRLNGGIALSERP